MSEKSILNKQAEVQELGGELDNSLIDTRENVWLSSIVIAISNLCNSYNITPADRLLSVGIGERYTP